PPLSPSGRPFLASPTQAGQTQALAKLDGRLVAIAFWDRLPYWLKAAWQPSLASGSGSAFREGPVAEASLRRYLERDASPLPLALAETSSAMPTPLRAVARARLETLAFPPARLEALAAHFDRLLDQSKARFLRHLSAPDRVDPDRDRVDLLAEVVALRNAQ